MCYKETPYHGCGHYGKRRFVGGEPCVRATTQAGQSQGCWDVVDMGITNVATLCIKCNASITSLRAISSVCTSESDASDDGSSIDGSSRGRRSSISTFFTSVCSSRSSSTDSSPQRPMPSMYAALSKTQTGGILKSCREL